MAGNDVNKTRALVQFSIRGLKFIVNHLVTKLVIYVWIQVVSL